MDLIMDMNSGSSFDGIDPNDVKVLGVDTQTIYQEQPNHKALSRRTFYEMLRRDIAESSKGL